MDKRRWFGVGALLGALVVTGIACRQQGPTGDPKTPPNSPIPDIDRQDDDTKASPAPVPVPGAGDAGS